MGNCLNIHVSKHQKKVKGLDSDGEFKASKLNSREYFSLIPDFEASCRVPVIVQRVRNGRSTGRKVKIVVTRKQLEFMIRKAGKFQALNVPFKCILGNQGCDKWRPSLDTIPEL